MPGGQASHKGSSAYPKPNTNAEGQLDVAADLEEDPRAELEPEGYEFDREEKEVNPKAMERPKK